MNKKCLFCGYVASHIVTCYECGKPLAPPVKLAASTTQKSRGLLALSEMRGAWPTLQVLQIRRLLKVVEELDPADKTHLPAFCRPCPPNPEHGFVESRVVKTIEDLERMRQETLAVCAESEIMMTQVFRHVENNSIWTPTLLTVGPGNDGATAGKKAVSFPLTGVNPFTTQELLLAGVNPTKAPYVEAILATPGGTFLTQLRSGPVLESGVHLDYIPVETVVEEIIQTAGEDLLEWAKVIRGLIGKSGVVIYHPDGALTDHYSVHCRENGVPILISHRPAIGEILEPLPMPPLDPDAMVKGLAVGSAMEMGNCDLYGPCVALSLMALHHSAALRGPHSFWIGLGAAVVAKLGSCAMDGEARHAEGHQVWKKFSSKPSIYQAYGKKSLHFHRARLSRLTQLLHFGFGEKGEKAGTGGEASGCGMGGRKWALCGAALAPLFTSIKRLTTAPTEAHASQLLLDLNVAINQSHNGGWWLNKFIAVQAYDEVPKGNIGYTLMASAAILEAARLAQTIDIERFKRNVAYWPETTSISPLRWRRADLEVGPGSMMIRVKASTLPQPKLIQIPTSAALIKSLIDKAGSIEIRPGEIILRTGDTLADHISLWKEPSLVATARNVHDRTQ